MHIFAAAEVLAADHPFVKTRPLHEATPESRMKARRSAEFLQPYRARPETCVALARRLVGGALGVRLHTTREEREAERKLLKEARGNVCFVHSSVTLLAPYTIKTQLSSLVYACIISTNTAKFCGHLVWHVITRYGVNLQRFGTGTLSFCGIYLNKVWGLIKHYSNTITRQPAK